MFIIDLQNRIYDPTIPLCVPRYGVWFLGEVIKTGACLMDLLNFYGDIPVYRFKDSNLITFKKGGE